MANYTSQYEHPRNRRRKRLNPLFLISVLALALVVLVIVAILLSGTPKLQLHDVLTMEAGGTLPSAQDFLNQESDQILSYATEPTGIGSQLGDHTVTVQWGNRSQDVTIRVVDTVAPTATKQDLTSKEIPAAADFVKDIVDATNVTVTFKSAPDASKEEQTVTLLLTDAAGNVTELEAALTLDNQAPQIQGAKDVVVYQGGTVAYRNGITVTDDHDGAPTWQVDSSKVDLTTPGEYPVVYTATDAYGNTASLTVTITVLEKRDTYVELDVINAAVDKLLGQIITPDMDLYQQVHKVYYWIRTNCRYSSKYNFKDDWRQAGYMMLEGRLGDCFYYFGLCKLMLERLGIPNIDVKKVPNYDGDSQHFWHLVSIDGGKNYYHVDTTPRTVSTYFCLVTDKEMDDFSAGYRNCFNRDKSLYPATPTERPR